MENEVKTKLDDEQQQVLDLFLLIKKLADGRDWKFCKHSETGDGRVTIFLKVVDKK